jgi:hypothetical protein
MKDISHYFIDLSDNSKNTSVTLNKVKKKHAKIDEINIVVNENLKTKKKRSKTKIKISHTTNKKRINMIENLPSCYLKSNKQHTTINSDHEKKNMLQFTLESNTQNNPLYSNNKNKNTIQQELKLVLDNSITKENMSRLNKDLINYTEIRTVENKVVNGFIILFYIFF